MFTIISKQELAKDITKLVISAPEIAKKAAAGQFVVVVADPQGERIPLTIADWDKGKGCITLIFQKVGYTTRRLGGLKPGDSVQHILGPLGHPTEVKKLGVVVCVGGGVGIAEIYPVCRAFKESGNQVIGIIGSRSRELIILEDEIRRTCDRLFITTDDGSYGQKGFVTDVLKGLLTERIALVYAVGPVPMMKAVADSTRDYKVKTIVSINPIMVDATGMCGACRCTVGGKTVFGCVDGPDFDGHQIDFEELAKRLKLFTGEEKKIDAK